MQSLMLIDIGSISNVPFRLQVSIRFWEKYQAWAQEHGEKVGVVEDTHIIRLTYRVPRNNNAQHVTDIPTRIIDAKDIQDMVKRFGCDFL